MSAVIDSSALLAVLNDERGAEVVLPVLRGGTASAIILSETIAKASDQARDTPGVLGLIRRFDIKVVSFDAEQALEAAKLRSATRGRNVSFADRACLALGVPVGMPIYTADRDWTKLGLGLDIRLIR